MQKERLFREIVGVLEELRDLHTGSDNREYQRFIELKLEEVYYKAIANNKYKLAETTCGIYNNLNKERFHN